MDEEGKRKEIQGILRPIKLGPLTTSQLAKCIRKRCQIYAIQVGMPTQNKILLP